MISTHDSVGAAIPQKPLILPSSKALSFQAKQPPKSAQNQTPYYFCHEHTLGKFYQ
ncbi:hypothetical protein [Neisseria yangbaofengii]|uniref:hypothetical protein n=1 Tax=Neisseria yangbaofengii TaxID=2709396 RepID=UPI0013EA7F13|nr:hypothetical protein [Neisseria yangbaofengii]